MRHLWIQILFDFAVALLEIAMIIAVAIAGYRLCDWLLHVHLPGL